MTFPSTLVEDAINEFAKLPGVGRKSALRYVLHLLKKDENEVVKFANVIEKMRTNIKFCITCHNIADELECNICKSHTRKQNTICVVETIRDLLAIENTQQYNGLYHITNGLIAPLDGIGPEKLYIQSLIERCKKGGVEEIILALNPTIEGDTTAFYIQKQLSEFNIKITAISRGVAFGGDLEYTDDMTLARSIDNRLPVSTFVQ